MNDFGLMSVKTYEKMFGVKLDASDYVKMDVEHEEWLSDLDDHFGAFPQRYRIDDRFY